MRLAFVMVAATLLSAPAYAEQAEYDLLFEGNAQAQVEASCDTGEGHEDFLVVPPARKRIAGSRLSCGFRQVGAGGQVRIDIRHPGGRSAVSTSGQGSTARIRLDR